MIHKNLFITATGTDVGKTVVATMLCRALGLRYWKPVQSGPDKDADFVAKWIGRERVSASRYELSRPLSPHQAAALDEVRVSAAQILMSAMDLPGPTVIEGAGGLLVPLNDKEYVIDLIRGLGALPVLVTSTALGTINHTLLSLEAMRARGIEPFGVIAVGDDDPAHLDAIRSFGRVPVFGRVPIAPAFSDEFFKTSFAGLNWPRPEVPNYAH